MQLYFHCIFICTSSCTKLTETQVQYYIVCAGAVSSGIRYKTSSHLLKLPERQMLAKWKIMTCHAFILKVMIRGERDENRENFAT